jgi:hypothetical protein
MMHMVVRKLVIGKIKGYFLEEPRFWMDLLSIFKVEISDSRQVCCHTSLEQRSRNLPQDKSLKSKSTDTPFMAESLALG